jgi:oxalate decarboxylase
MGHYIENTGPTKLQFLKLWKTDKFADVSLRQLLAFTPFDLVQAHLMIDRSVLANIPTRKTPVVPA